MSNEPNLTKTAHPPERPSETRTLIEGARGPVSPSSASPSFSVESGDRYRIGGELGRGGMGIVYRATDTLLGREIAIKVLKDSAGLRSATASRFLDEALVTSQLQHPGIPAVYDLGMIDGQPFLAMKLIRGETLTERLNHVPAPGDRGELIAVFEHVCHAVAYAHDHRVIHRDLKPSNIMVGAFGEVQVMDWGLAKKLISNSESAHFPVENGLETWTEIRTARDNDDASTLPGSALGTPAFTPPEQAGGEIEKMDERVDVFGLGAVLCTILTGQPPYVAETGEAIRLMAIRGDLEGAFTRLDQCGADPELVDLCRRCLARNPEDRLRHAKAVANAVSAYRTGVEGRLRTAERTAAVAAAKSIEQRKRRRVQLALVASLLVLTSGTLAGLWWNQKQFATRLAEAENKANLALNKADQFAGLIPAGEVETVGRAETGVALARQALAAAEQAEGIVAATGDPTLAARVDARVEVFREGVSQATTTLARARRDAGLLAALEQAHGTSADLQRTKTDVRGAKAYRAAFAAAGLPWDGSPELLARAIRTERPRVRAALITSLDHWTWCLGSDKVAASIREAADLADGDSFRREIRAAVGVGDTAALLRLAARAESNSLPPVTATLLARALMDRQEYRTAAGVLLAARERNPGDYWVLTELAHVLWELPPGEKFGRIESLACTRAALAVRPESAMTHNRLGYSLSVMGDAAGAEASYRRAIQLDPTLAEAWHNLALAIDVRGDLAGAEEAYRKAITCNARFALAHVGLGFVLLRKGALAEAEISLRKGIECDPASSVAHLNLGVVLERRGNVLGARDAYQQAVTCDPQSALAHSNFGEAQLWLAEWAGAESSYRKAIELAPRFTLGHKNLGWLLFLRDDHSGAEACFRKALEFDLRDGGSLGVLGWILERKGDLAGAERCQRDAARLDPGGDAAHFFQAHRLAAQPKTPGDLKRILDESLAQRSEWSPRQRRAARSAAAIAAAWSARPEAPGVSSINREGFSRLARELLADLMTELVAGLAAGQEELPGEMIAATANWLGDRGLAHVRNPFRLALLPAGEAIEWARVWATVHATRQRCLKPTIP